MSDTPENDLDLDLDFADDGDTQLDIPQDMEAEAEAVEDEMPALGDDFESAAAAVDDQALGEQALGLTADVPVQLVVVVGKKRITMQDLLQLQQGQVFDLGAPVSNAVDLVANGKLVAKGELVDIDGQMGVRINSMCK